MKMQILKIPVINGLGKTKGCENAPDSIILELKGAYSNEKGRAIDSEAYNLQEIKTDSGNLEESSRKIYQESKKFFAKKEFCISLGGDHSVSYPLCKAFSELSENAGFLIFDAHAGCMHDFSPPAHEGWLRVLVEHDIPAKNAILAGLRNIHPIEAKFLADKKIRYFSQSSMSGHLEDACDAIMEAARKFDSLYISLDIDAVDPAFAPAVAYPEPCGLSSREIIYMVQRLGLLKNLKAVDIVEVNPMKDLNSITSRLAAKIISELAR